jgi:hypothetical protein
MKNRIGLRIILALAVVSSAWTAGCDKERADKETKAAPMTYKVRLDSAGLAEKLNLPAPAASVRWIVTPVVPGAGGPRDIGPTDTRLFALIGIAEKDWTVWMDSLGKPKGRSDHHLSAALADSLLPAELLARTPLDSVGRKIEGPYYDPSKIAKIWYDGVVAARIGDFLFLEFTSR